MKHDFGEKEKESFKAKDGKWVEVPVWKSPKYEQSKAKAIEMIEGGNFGLTDSDFWILMNTYANETKMMYTGLIISHNGCLKINDVLENKFRSEFMSREWVGDTLIYEYNDGELYEVGEVSPKNCKNAYPYAMAFKRCFDRVVLKKSKLAFSGIYSEVEADEFKEEPREEKKKSEIFDEPLPNRNIKEYANEFRRIVPKEAQTKILADLNANRAEDIGLAKLQIYIEHYGQK